MSTDHHVGPAISQVIETQAETSDPKWLGYEENHPAGPAFIRQMVEDSAMRLLKNHMLWFRLKRPASFLLSLLQV